MNLWQFLRVKIIGWWTWRRRHEDALYQAYRRTEALEHQITRLDRDAERDRKYILEQVQRMRGTENVNSRTVYEVIEDLKARMPKGSAVSDHRMNQEIGKLVARIEKLEHCPCTRCSIARANTLATGRHHESDCPHAEWAASART